MEQRKSFEIPKSLVWQAYLEVRKNQGSAGCDKQTIEEFDRNRNRNLYKIWNRLSSGSYIPQPVMEKEIPKPDGKVRVLGIPTVSDRIAQGAVKIYMERHFENVFCEDSYGYRPGRSAHQALNQCKERCWRYPWVLEIDIKSFFDSVNHDLILTALEHNAMPKWVLLYCQRWLKAPMQKASGDLVERGIGTPQGGVISPLLANIFLHYAFDKWMQRTSKSVPFERYADDIVCHCKTMKEAEGLKATIIQRLEEVGLELNLEKTNIVYVDTFKRWNVKRSFTFLGYDFELRIVKQKSGKLKRVCMPGASKKAMKRVTKTMRSLNLHRYVKATINDIAEWINPMLAGWVQYYGKFWSGKFRYRLWSCTQSRLIKWIENKYKVAHRKARLKLESIRKEQPKLFVHWYLKHAKSNECLRAV